MHAKKRKITKKNIIIILSALFLIIMALGFLMLNFKKQMEQIPKMSVDEMLSYTLEDKDKAVTTIGIIKDGKMEYTVYGKDGNVLDDTEYDYEIGSLTKTFTCSLLSKAVFEGKVDMNASIDTYLNLPTKNYYPTLKRLATHTSGYKEYYLEGQMISNFFHGEENDFYGISRKSLNNRIAKINLEDKDYNFKYSNFGMATLGEVLTQVYNEDYSVLMNQYIKEDLGLLNTRISSGKDEIPDCWNWEKNDAYLPAGSLISNISDMLKYLNIHMTNQLPYLKAPHEVWAQADGNKSSYEMMGIRIDAQGLGWMIDTKHNIIWHNGGTSNYNCYIGFDSNKQIGVVVLSNLSPNYKIPATVIGARVLQELQEGN